MASRYIGKLIQQIGLETKNPRAFVTSTSGVSDNEILEYLNDAQNRLFATIVTNQGMTRRFDSTFDIQLVAGTMGYDLPDRVGFGRNIRRVEFWQGTSYIGTLDPLVMAPDWDDSLQSDPSGYLSVGGQIRLNCKPTSGFLRVWCAYQPYALDIRRGTISAVGAPSGGNYPSITLANDTVLSSDLITEGTNFYISVVDRNGLMLYPNVDVASYNSGTRVLTLQNTPTSGGTIPVGAFITIGEYTSSHCLLSKARDIVETFLKAYAVKKLNQVDSSTDIMTSDAELKGIAQQIFELVSSEYTDNISVALYNNPWTQED